MAKPEPRLLPTDDALVRTDPKSVLPDSVAAPGYLLPAASWARVLVAPLLDVYSRTNTAIARRGRWGLRLADSHGLLFAFASLVALALAPRFLMLGYYLIAEIITDGVAIKPDTSVVPFTPDSVAVVLGAFVLTFAMPRNWRLFCGGVVSLWFPLVHFGISPLGMSIFGCYVAALYAIAKIRISRYAVFAVAVTLTGTAIALLSISQTVVESGILVLMGRFPIIVPMIWYTMIEEMPGRRKLQPVRHTVYHYLRTLHSPVITFKDIFGPTGAGLVQIRTEGFKALFTVLAAVFVVDAIGSYSGRVNEPEMSGLSLLVFSYLQYVRTYCLFVIAINVVIGGLRLMGVPVRNNFNWWLLARTPNEHWRRWNMLMREWVVGFIFFPIMRARRWLFVAVMASLLSSGLLHIAPGALTAGVDWVRSSIIMTYWGLNGVAIYAFIKIPLIAPDFVERLRFRTSRLWWAAGVVSTSAFYGILVHVRQSCRSWDQVGTYFERLFGV